MLLYIFRLKIHPHCFKLLELIILSTFYNYNTIIISVFDNIFLLTDKHRPSKQDYGFSLIQQSIYSVNCFKVKKLHSGGPS
jgi:hypothetical protein